MIENGQVSLDEVIVPIQAMKLNESFENEMVVMPVRQKLSRIPFPLKEFVTQKLKKIETMV